MSLYRFGTYHLFVPEARAPADPSSGTHPPWARQDRGEHVPESWYGRIWVFPTTFCGSRQSQNSVDRSSTYPASVVLSQGRIGTWSHRSAWTMRKYSSSARWAFPMMPWRWVAFGGIGSKMASRQDVYSSQWVSWHSRLKTLIRCPAQFRSGFAHCGYEARVTRGK